MSISKKVLNEQIKGLIGKKLNPLKNESPATLIKILNTEDALVFENNGNKKITKKLSSLRILVESLTDFPAINPAQILGASSTSIKELTTLLANTPNVGFFKDKSVVYLTTECLPHVSGEVFELLPGEASKIIGKIKKLESLDRKYLLNELVNAYNTLNIFAKENNNQFPEINSLLKQLRVSKSQADAIFSESDKYDEENPELEDQFQDDEQDDEDIKFDPSKLDIKTNTPTIDLMIARIEHNEIILNPDFQRKDRIWKDPDKSALIESILLKIPIPVFYMSAKNADEWLVVDGLQRLTTMYDFVKDQFSLKGLKILSQYDGLKFSQFPRSLARRIQETELVVHVIQPGSPRNATSQIFHRINTLGEKLSPQEIRSSLNVGYATKFLVKLAESNEFVTATNDSINPNRMQDIEYVLRFCSFYRETDYSDLDIKTMDKLLTETMKWLNNEGASSAAVEKMSADFYKSMKYARRIFGQYAFRKKLDEMKGNQINKALFETWTVCLAKTSFEDLETLVVKKDKLLADFESLLSGDLILASWSREENHGKDFEYSTSQSTSKTDMIHFRYSSISSLIARIVSNDN
jgi:hypothetical protein